MTTVGDLLRAEPSVRAADVRALAKVMVRFGLGVVDVKVAPAGSNRNWIVTSDNNDRMFVVREYEGSAVVPWFRNVAITDQTAAFGTPPYLHPVGASGRPGRPLVAACGRRFLVRPYISGTTVSTPDRDQVFRVGRLLKRIAGHQWDDIGVFAPSIIVESKQTSPQMPAWMLQLHEASEMVLDRWRSGSEQTVVHGDLSRTNMVFDRDGEPIPFDWEIAGFAHPAMDLAGSIVGCCWNAGRQDDDLAAAMIDGYGGIDTETLDDAFIVIRTKIATNRWWRNDPTWKDLQ